ncbi:MAG: MarR family winged helix-turn-helix transcriptional regulator [Candidatus Thorarchaeota archaeon]
MTNTRQELMYELAELLRRLSRVKWFLGDSELDLEGFMILDHLTETEKTTMSEIVKSFSLPASTATGIVDRLVKKKYVKRQHSSEDRRKVELQITESGERAHNNFRMTALKTMDESLSHLSMDEIQEITNLVRKLIERLA